MLKIRMQRTGRINSPSFRIVVIEHTRSPKAGNFLEKLGTYNPKTKERNLNAERIKYWLSVGAQASGTMHNMLISAGVIEGKKVNVLPKKSPPKPAAAESSGEVKKEATPAEGSGEPKEERPAEALAKPADLPAEASAQAGAPAKADKPAVAEAKADKQE